MTGLDESAVEDIALGWLGELGYAIAHGPHIAPGEPAAERASFGQVVLEERLREAIQRLNPHIPADAQEEALRKRDQAAVETKPGPGRVVQREASTPEMQELPAFPSGAIRKPRSNPA